MYRQPRQGLENNQGEGKGQHIRRLEAYTQSSAERRAHFLPRLYLASFLWKATAFSLLPNLETTRMRIHEPKAHACLYLRCKRASVGGRRRKLEWRRKAKGAQNAAAACCCASMASIIRLHGRGGCRGQCCLSAAGREKRKGRAPRHDLDARSRSKGRCENKPGPFICAVLPAARSFSPSTGTLLFNPSSLLSPLRLTLRFPGGGGGGGRGGGSWEQDGPDWSKLKA